MLTQYTKKFVRYLRNSKAISALEYAILLGVISVALVAALGAFSNSITNTINAIAGNINTSAGTVGSTPSAPSSTPSN